MSKLRTVLDNTVVDMWRFGWVVLQYDFWHDRWTGRDEAGNIYSVETSPFQDRTLDWLDFLCDGISYRCCKPESLKKAGAERIPKGNAANNR
jgi:hypothetical protein